MNQSKDETLALHDPFGVDIFNETRSTEQLNVASEPIIEPFQDLVSDAPPPPAPLWSRNLPKLSREEAAIASLFSAARDALSDKAIDTLIQTLSFYTKAPPNQITIEKIHVYQIQLNQFLAEAGKSHSVFLSLAVEPRGDNLLIYADAGFIASIINLLLGGDGTPPSVLRSLSKTERAVVEFLSLANVRALNKIANAPWLKLESVTDEFPNALHASKAANFEETFQEKQKVENIFGTVFCFRLNMGPVNGLARIFASQQTLASLDHNHNPLFVQNKSGRLAKFKRITNSVITRMLIGETQIEAVDLVALEIGDVVLIEHPLIKWTNGNINGKTRLFIGDEQNFTIVGAVATTDVLKFQIKEITIKSDNRAHTRSRMEEIENTNQTAVENGGGINVGPITMTVHIELATQRLTLEEISSLHEGQVIELGRSPTDLVDLVTDNWRVATGELVEIEGRLGVRINQVFV